MSMLNYTEIVENAALCTVLVRVPALSGTRPVCGMLWNFSFRKREKVSSYILYVFRVHQGEKMAWLGSGINGDYVLDTLTLVCAFALSSQHKNTIKKRKNETGHSSISDIMYIGSNRTCLQCK